jgi:hypothetical protein
MILILQHQGIDRLGGDRCLHLSFLYHEGVFPRCRDHEAATDEQEDGDGIESRDGVPIQATVVCGLRQLVPTCDVKCFYSLVIINSSFCLITLDHNITPLTGYWIFN